MHREPGASIAQNEQAWADKSPWHAIQSDSYRYARPGMNPYYGTSGAPQHARPKQRGILLGEEVFDSTLARATTRLANRIVNDVCPPGKKWVKFKGTLVKGEADKANEGRLETLRDRSFQAIHTSNGDQAIHEMVTDCVVAGNGVVRIGAGPTPAEPLVFDSTSQSEVAFEAGPRGAIWGYHRMFLLPKEHIEAMWPESERIVEPVHERREDGVYRPPLYTVYECTYFDPKKGHWWYDVLLRGSKHAGSHQGTRIFEETSPISRWVGWRWSRMPGEVYGRSPVMDALPDARTASELVRILLATGSLRISGLFTYEDGGIVNPDTMSMEPGSFIEVRSNRRDQPSLTPLQVGGDVNMAQLVLEDLRMSVEKAMLGQGLPPEGAGIRSATEWVARLKELNQQIGAAFSRLTQEMLRPLMQSVVYVLSERGLLADVGIPQGRQLRLDGTDMNLDFQSPLVRSQSLEDVSSLVEACQMAQAASGPMGFQAAANAPRIAAKIFELQGVHSDLSRDEDEAEAQYQEQMQAQAAAATPPNVNQQPAGMEAPG